MSDAKHTPGPWQADKDCGDSGYRAVYDEHGRKLALVFDDETRANASLIAAAPDLLKALRAAMAYINDEPGKPGLTWLRREARIALTRAKDGR